MDTQPIPVQSTQPIPVMPQQMPQAQQKYPLPSKPGIGDMFMSKLPGQVQDSIRKGLDQAAAEHRRKYDEYQARMLVENVPVSTAAPEMYRDIRMPWQQQPGKFEESLDMKTATAATFFSPTRPAASLYLIGSQATMDGKLIGNNVMTDGTKQPFYRRPMNSVEKWIYGVIYFTLSIIYFPMVINMMVMNNFMHFTFISTVFGIAAAIPLFIDYLLRRSNRREAMLMAGVAGLAVSSIGVTGGSNDNDDWYQNPPTPLR